jgi:hypothetical protein
VVGAGSCVRSSVGITKPDFYTKRPALHNGPPDITTLKSQNATIPSDPEEAPSKPMPKPTPEQRSNTKGSSPEFRQFPVFFQFFRAVVNSNPNFIFIQLYPLHIKQNQRDLVENHEYTLPLNKPLSWCVCFIFNIVNMKNSL